MKTRPILFSAPMVRALLDGSKTQTRRVVKPQPITRTEFKGEHFVPPSKRTQGRIISVAVPWVGEASPYGQIGDQLWVKETHFLYGRWVKNGLTKTGKQKWQFKADKSKGVHFEAPTTVQTDKETGVGWWKRSSLFMPRWASRITLEITSVRVERLNDISIGDVDREGTPANYPSGASKDDYAHLWESINGKGSWDTNPWVWVIEFKRVAPCQ